MQLFLIFTDQLDLNFFNLAKESHPVAHNNNFKGLLRDKTKHNKLIRQGITKSFS